ncbi:MFS transporter [Paenalcaligenes niemegkensis]|uniref:MFS transporter n=1 Tax=Paenalcaligenes niemegkensis TaxID=2895469 RepID=UPI001EE78AAC|nr:MFS transporter [Paenalcaligenes niemegkensis]MCQ9618306.1 MFS transporter [Paenalcaligenes niemegkensis]
MQPDSRRWKVLGLMALAIMLVMTTWFSATAVVLQLTEHLGLSDSGRVWLTISVQLGFVAGALCSAFFGCADRFTGRTLILSGSLLVAAINLSVLWLDSAGLVIVARLFTGFFLAIVYPPAMKLTATWFLKQRGVALGTLIAAITIGTATPHLVNALGGLAWEVVIVCTSIFALAGGVIVALFISEGPYPYPSYPFNLAAAMRAFRNPAVAWVTVGYLGHMWELYAMWAWFAVFFQFVLDKAAIANSGILASSATFVVIAVGGVGCVLAGLTSDRFGRASTAFWALVVSGLMAASIGFLNAYPLLVFFLALVWGITIVADSAQFSALLTEVAQGEYVGSVLTIQVALGYLLTVPIIWLVPVLVRNLGWGAAFLSLSLGSLVGAYAMRRTKRLMVLREVT